MSTIHCVRENIEKNKLRTLSHTAHTTPHIVSTMSSSGYKIVDLELKKKLTHHLELHEKAKCLTSHFYLIIGMVDRLRKK